MTAMDWTKCAATETVPGRLAGRPVIRGSRVRLEDLLTNREQGAEWLARNHGIAVETVREVLAFHDRHDKASRAAHPA